MMYKLFVFAAVMAVAFAEASPAAKADAKPSPLLAYSAPIVAAAPVAYSSYYSAPLTYAAAPLAYTAAYPAYSAYASPYVAVV